MKIAPTVVVFHLVDRFDLDSSDGIDNLPDRIWLYHKVVVNGERELLLDCRFDQFNAAARKGGVDLAALPISALNEGVAGNRNRRDRLVFKVHRHEHDRVGSRILRVGNALAISIVILTKQQEGDSVLSGEQPTWIRNPLPDLTHADALGPKGTQNLIGFDSSNDAHDDDQSEDERQNTA